MIDRQNGGRCGERQVGERGRLAAPGVGDIETGAGDLDGLRPGKGADRRLQRAADAIREGIVENAVPGANRSFAVAARIPGDADARHHAFVIVGDDPRGHAVIAGEKQSGRRIGKDG